MKRSGLEIDDRVRVIGPLAEHYECNLGVVRSVYVVGGLKRYRVELDSKDMDDFFATELRYAGSEQPNRQTR